MKTISAVVLAGGASARYGRNKLTLPLGGSTVIQECVHAFSALPLFEVIVVTGRYHDEIASLTFDAGVRLVHNKDHRLGMSASVRCGLTALQEKVKGILVCPADMPLIQSSTVVSVIHAFRPGRCVVPRYQNKRGHPILLSAAVARWCRETETDKILLEALEKSGSRVVELDVEDEGVLIDLDRPEDYDAMVVSWDRLNGRSDL